MKDRPSSNYRYRRLKITMRRQPQILLLIYNCLAILPVSLRVTSAKYRTRPKHPIPSSYKHPKTLTYASRSAEKAYLDIRSWCITGSLTLFASVRYEESFTERRFSYRHTARFHVWGESRELDKSTDGRHSMALPRRCNPSGLFLELIVCLRAFIAGDNME